MKQAVSYVLVWMTVITLMMAGIYTSWALSDFVKRQVAHHTSSAPALAGPSGSVGSGGGG